VFFSVNDMTHDTRFDVAALQDAEHLLAGWLASDACTAIDASVGNADRELWRMRRDKPTAKEPALGETLPGETLPDLFLIASPTKPIVALMVARLAEQGAFSLADPVMKFIPEFRGKGKRKITLAHCLTHTSGLPDMLPENRQLRCRHASMDEFVQKVCETPLLFAPGRKVSYQSMGILMLAEIMRRVLQQPLAEAMRTHIFQPLQMHDTALGAPPDWPATRFAPVRMSAEMQTWEGIEHWGWNSDYWRRFGSPWGGLLSTSADLGKLCRHLLQILRGEQLETQPGVVSRAALQAMTRDQLGSFPHAAELRQHATPWGYGWQMQWPNHPHTFADFMPPTAFGHWGATGTLVWLDPASGSYCVLLTNEPLPARQRPHTLFSNVVRRGIRLATVTLGEPAIRRDQSPDLSHGDHRTEHSQLSIRRSQKK